MTQANEPLREKLKAMNLSVRYMEGIGFVGKKRLGDVISGRDLDQILDLILAERRAADTKTLETVASILSGTGGSGDITAERVVEIAQSYIRNKLQLNNGESE